MKKILLALLSIISFITLTNCGSVFRVFNDEDLDVMAQSDYGFTSVLFFKIVDSETAIELTGDSYNNSGVIYGVKDDAYAMIFMPKLASKEEFLIDYEPIYDVVEIYQMLNVLENETGDLLFNDPSGDYGGLSISVTPYESIANAFPSLVFDSPIFFIITTDQMVFNVGRIENNYVVFDQDLKKLN
ncbi:hypothetical protein [Mariniplasma anaerobium]|uniref:Uncharacterized protein n=1 Tax=Mariniplasma anaerobium TaxID=2735436 RepID=A0A7U9XVF8_9MOLU|nr:hypothetical protein [Mariniplasma anaerobium]BCR35251.1 hypothetical protein MPAN_001440 [Mariniplasma anaerobium]